MRRYYQTCVLNMFLVQYSTYFSVDYHQKTWGKRVVKRTCAKKTQVRFSGQMRLYMAATPFPTKFQSPYPLYMSHIKSRCAVRLSEKFDGESIKAHLKPKNVLSTRFRCLDAPLFSLSWGLPRVLLRIFTSYGSYEGDTCFEILLKTV